MEYDLVIIGAGPAGLSMAIAILRQCPLSVLVIDGKAKNMTRIGESCPPELLVLMNQLGLDKTFKSAGHQASPGYSSVWGMADVGHNDSIVSPLGPSWCLDREKFDEMLADHVEHLKGEIRWNTRFLDVKQLQNRSYSLRLKDNNSKQEISLEAKFVVDASGSKARFAHAIGVEKSLDDTLFAHVRFAEILSGKMTRRVQLEATKEGWWYQVSLPENKLVSMMVTNQEEIKNLQKNDSQTFDEALSKTTFISQQSERVSLKKSTYITWPIYSGILNKIEDENWMAIGDAASSFDPIMARGIYKGISDGLKGANKVVSFFKNDMTYVNNSFSEHIRQRYEQYRQNRIWTYAIERRWLDEPFWRDRLVDVLEAK